MNRLPFRSVPIALGAAIVLCACATSVNSPIVVGDGEAVSSGLNTVNGGVTIGSDADVAGTCRSVNGNIEIGDRAHVEGVSAVNGAIRGGEGRADRRRRRVGQRPRSPSPRPPRSAAR